MRHTKRDTRLMTLTELLAEGRSRLMASGASLEDAQIDARVLLEETLDIGHTQLITSGDKHTSHEDQQRFLAAIGRRVHGEPVAHIVGRRGFWSLNLTVNGDTLIPRPETEMLVELALEAGDENAPVSVLDLCTGSGAVALALASERPAWSITGTDISPDALAVAGGNAEELGLGNVQFIQGDLYRPVKAQRFQIIVANPPYILADDPHLTQGDLRFEPRLALAAGHDGLDVIRPLLDQAQEHLLPGGHLYVEHGYDQRESILALAGKTALNHIRDLDDYAGQPRVLAAVKN